MTHDWQRADDRGRDEPGWAAPTGLLAALRPAAGEPRPGRLYGGRGGGSRPGRDWLLLCSAAFFAVAVLLGGVFAWQGPTTSGDGRAPRTSLASAPLAGAGAPLPGAGAPLPGDPTPSPTPSTADGVPAGPFTLTAVHSGMCLDAPAGEHPDGVHVVQAPCTGAPTQRWTATPVASDQAYTIANLDSMRCLDVEGGADNDGAVVQQYQCHGQANQQWRLVRDEAGTFAVIGVHSGKCLDVFGASGGPGAPVLQWGCHGGPNQRWTLG